MKSVLLWFFSNKNHFVSLVFITYILTVIGFAGIYWVLILIDSQKQPHTISNFIINTEIADEKIKQNKFELMNAIGEDSAKLLTVNAQLAYSYRQLPRALLTRITTSRNDKFYLSPSVTDQLRDNVKANQWGSYSKLILPGPDRSKEIIVRRLLNGYIVWEHSLQVYPPGLIMSRMYATNGKNKLLLSAKIFNKEDQYVERYLQVRTGNFLVKWLFNRYRNAISSQLITVANPEHQLEDGPLIEYMQISNEHKHLQKNLKDSKRALLGITKPDWSFLDIIFFTVVSLFANNYSDIYPNSTTARVCIMLEFIIVWFLTICVISLEPNDLGFVKRWKKSESTLQHSRRSKRGL